MCGAFVIKNKPGSKSSQLVVSLATWERIASPVQQEALRA